MIYGKAILSPALTRRTVTRKLSLFSEQSGALMCRGVNFRREGDSIVCAEGARKRYDLPEGVRSFHTSSGNDRRGWAYADDGTLYSLDESSAFADVPPFRALVGCRTLRNEDALFAVGVGKVSLLFQGRATDVGGAAGGDCACLSAERLFTARGDVVRFSSPLSPENWTGGLPNAGYVELPSSDGEILFLEEIGGEILLVRRRGLWKLKTSGNTLAFRAERLPYAGGEIDEGSVAVLGGKIVFLASDGLYSFDGSRAKRIPGCGFSRLYPGKAVKAVSAAGIYCASVECRDGEMRLWLVEPEQERGHFLGIRAEMLAGGTELLFANGGGLYGLTERGFFPGDRAESSLVTERSLLGLSPRKKYLDGVTVEGEGRFLVEARAEKGAARAAAGEAGSRLLFPVPVSGTSFFFHITSSSERARIESLTFELREETGKW